MNKIIKYRGKVEGRWDYATPDDSHWDQFWALVDSETIGQFTGVKDCEGEEIYEDDIVSSAPGDANYTGIVRFGLTELEHDAISIKVIGFYVDTPIESLRQFVTEEMCNEEVLIVGNIHNNPDMAEAQS